MTDKTVELHLASHCPGLEDLQLSGCSLISNPSLRAIATSLRRLRRLKLRSCWQVSDAGVMSLTSATPGPPLEELHLQDCQRVSDNSLRHISQGLGSLTSLNLSFCANISDSGMKSLSKISSLRTLNLRSCDNISDIGVGYLAEGCVSLQSLDLSFCRVTDAAMNHIASGLFNLRSLSLVQCRITDEGVAKICKTLADLHFLNIGQCSLVSDLGLSHIGARLGQLRGIDLYGCVEVTQTGLASLKMGCPKLSQINVALCR